VIPLAAVLAAGCYQGVEAGVPAGHGPAVGGVAEDSGEDPGDADPDAPEPATCAGEPLTVGEAPLRRLTSRQYRNVVTDLFGLGEDALPLDVLDYVLDGRAGAFAANTLAVDTQTVRAYLLIAEDLADAFVEQALPQALECAWSDPQCVESFVTDFGRRAYRRPLTDEQIDALVELHAGIVAQDGEAVAMAAVVTAIIASPAFLYHEEPVRESDRDTAEVDEWAFASRLSFLLWDSAPDEELLDAAEAGDLETASGIEAQVDRMLEDERFDRTLAAFYGQWSGVDALDDLGSSDPSFTTSLRDAMRAETLAFASHVHREDGRLSTLLGADFGFADDELAAIYGVEAPQEPFGRVDLVASERAGLLTHAGVLAVTAATPFPVIFRGKFVNERLLCNTLVLPENVEADPAVDRLETQPCMGCHLHMDPIGDAFARYDALGRYLERDAAGAAIPEHGEIPGRGGFDGARELADLLLADERTHRCIAREWATFAVGRVPTSDDDCAVDELGAAFAESDGDLGRLVRDLATSTWLRARSTAQP
jgi:hypothetical protein